MSIHMSPRQSMLTHYPAETTWRLRLGRNSKRMPSPQRRKRRAKPLRVRRRLTGKSDYEPHYECETSRNLFAVTAPPARVEGYMSCPRRNPATADLCADQEADAGACALGSRIRDRKQAIEL